MSVPVSPVHVDGDVIHFTSLYLFSSNHTRHIAKRPQQMEHESSHLPVLGCLESRRWILSSVSLSNQRAQKESSIGQTPTAQSLAVGTARLYRSMAENGRETLIQLSCISWTKSNTSVNLVDRLLFSSVRSPVSLVLLKQPRFRSQQYNVDETVMLRTAGRGQLGPFDHQPPQIV